MILKEHALGELTTSAETLVAVVNCGHVNTERRCVRSVAETVCLDFSTVS